VYESLLELVPMVSDEGRRFVFAGADESAGNARKLTHGDSAGVAASSVFRFAGDCAGRRHAWTAAHLARAAARGWRRVLPSSICRFPVRVGMHLEYKRAAAARFAGCQRSATTTNILP